MPRRRRRARLGRREQRDGAGQVPDLFVVRSRLLAQRADHLSCGAERLALSLGVEGEEHARDGERHAHSEVQPREEKRHAITCTMAKIAKNMVMMS